jgi:hypothetical protein
MAAKISISYLSARPVRWHISLDSISYRTRHFIYFAIQRKKLSTSFFLQPTVYRISTINDDALPVNKNTSLVSLHFSYYVVITVSFQIIFLQLLFPAVSELISPVFIAWTGV